jgi:hypothetical protein
MTSIVNIERDYGSALERDLAQVLRELLSNVSWLQRWNVGPANAANGGWDLKGSGPIPGGGKAVVCVECKGPNFQPSQFSSLFGRVCSAGRRVASYKVLAMPHVSPRMAAL